MHDNQGVVRDFPLQHIQELKESNRGIGSLILALIDVINDSKIFILTIYTQSLIQEKRST